MGTVGPIAEANRKDFLTPDLQHVWFLCYPSTQMNFCGLLCEFAAQLSPNRKEEAKTKNRNHSITC